MVAAAYLLPAQCSTVLEFQGTSSKELVGTCRMEVVVVVSINTVANTEYLVVDRICIHSQLV